MKNFFRVLATSTILVLSHSQVAKSAEPSIEETEQFIKHIANNEMILIFRSKPTRHVFEFDGAQFYYTYELASGYDRYKVEIKDLAEIRIVGPYNDKRANDIEAYGCPRTLVFAACAGNSECMSSETVSQNSQYTSPRKGVGFRFCEGNKQQIKRFANALKHLSILHGNSIKVVDPESTGSSFD